MKKKVAILAGGDSSEYEVSLGSAKQMGEWLNKEKYEVYPVLVKGADWVYQSPDKQGFPVDKNDFSVTVNGEKIKFDYALIAIHGTPGEDGKLQAYFELLRIPYSTGGVLSTALTFNKHATKQYLKNYKIHMPAWYMLRENDPVNSLEILREVGLPCFVKPNNGGSSCGVTKVSSESQLEEAVELARKEDHEVMIEEYIEGIEVTCGLVKTGKKEVILPLTEIVSKNEFFDYEAKYTPGMADEISPARISDNHTRKCMELSSKIYDILDCRGIVRVDFFLKKNKFYFIEINTVPGMSFNSIIPKQAKEMGITMTELFDLAIEDTSF